MERGKSNVVAEQRNGNLFINLEGDFDKRLITAMRDCISSYGGKGNIFVNAEKMNRAEPSGREAVQTIAAAYNLSRRKFFFIGKRSMEICPEGYRVIVRKKRCCGRCKNCSC